jgi:hypothetical protein
MNCILAIGSGRAGKASGWEKHALELTVIHLDVYFYGGSLQDLKQGLTFIPSPPR